MFQKTQQFVNERKYYFQSKKTRIKWNKVVAMTRTQVVIQIQVSNGQNK
jgi:hypothetical protein